MSKLTLAEDIILLLLDDDTGKMEDLHANVTEMLMAGAVLMDLGLRKRIDCDLERLFVVDATPTSDAILDETLAQIETEAESLPPKTWIQRIAEQGMGIRQAAIERLERRNIIKVEDTSFLWVFGSRRYPVIDDREEREAKLRLMDVLLSDKIPDPHDVALICLADSASVFEVILSERELRHAGERIEQVRKLDLIGQAMSDQIRKFVYDITMAIAHAQQPLY